MTAPLTRNVALLDDPRAAPRRDRGIRGSRGPGLRRAAALGAVVAAAGCAPADVYEPGAAPDAGGRRDQLSRGADAGAADAGAADAASADAGDPSQPMRVLVLNLDPVIESRGSERLHEVMGWNDPRAVFGGYAEDLRSVSGGRADYVLAEWIDVDGYPVHEDGFRYDDAGYLALFEEDAEPRDPGRVDWEVFIEKHELAERVDAGEIDEVVVMGAPYFGFYESRMVGPRAYWVNSPGLEWPSQRNFIVMALNYERGVAEALHAYGHRAESIMRHVFGGWSGSPYDDEDPGEPESSWDRFAVTDAVAPGDAGCGTVHHPPNAEDDYDYDVWREVPSRCEAYVAGSAEDGEASPVSRETWGGPDFQRNYLRWWYRHIPRASGRGAEGMLADWWAYIADFDAHPESGGHACTEHRGDVDACDATSGCAYYFCTEECYPEGTSLDAVCGP